jgi:hypothetical protein
VKKKAPTPIAISAMPTQIKNFASPGDMTTLLPDDERHASVE